MTRLAAVIATLAVLAAVGSCSSENTADQPTSQGASERTDGGAPSPDGRSDSDRAQTAAEAFLDALKGKRSDELKLEDLSPVADDELLDDDFFYLKKWMFAPGAEGQGWRIDSYEPFSGSDTPTDLGTGPRYLFPVKINAVNDAGARESADTTLYVGDIGGVWKVTGFSVSPLTMGSG